MPEGAFLALRRRVGGESPGGVLLQRGAHSSIQSAAPTSSAISLYDIRACMGGHRLVSTNTTPTHRLFAAAGPSHVSYLWERLVRTGRPRVTGIDSRYVASPEPDSQDAFRSRPATRLIYDSGRSGAGLLDTACSRRDWKGIQGRPQGKHRKGRQKLRGSWFGRCFLSRSAAWAKEQVESGSAPDGRLAIVFDWPGVRARAMETVFPALVADVLAFGGDRIELRYNEFGAPKLAGVGYLRGSRSDSAMARALQAAREGKSSRRAKKAPRAGCVGGSRPLTSHSNTGPNNRVHRGPTCPSA